MSAIPWCWRILAWYELTLRPIPVRGGIAYEEDFFHETGWVGCEGISERFLGVAGAEEGTGGTRSMGLWAALTMALLA
ncbi:hypothetical protein FOXG_19661 [Fusarium oxysporum f. sp. lycopersici 4287]|uniref:Uncharacterized protein n=1 Tax=Fusarium oxysporum f. sp. lycopersici (strain 4287 / CBS 123668 / FGSC 9935 / NRRL 34936) TaxID=426428 RepID=A0A0J9WMZ8_FUSO4|nr:hypothetical protein FOXG_19661 [Fusarium oxysporum f. sp. lycopersici 4287]KNB06407.1 hypothetical protein FOXG_19661 [Fusarium oxysporum f. sp. lycopersici 4287]